MTPEKLKKLAFKVADRHAPLTASEINQAVQQKLGTLTDKGARGIEPTAHCGRVAFGGNDE